MAFRLASIFVALGLDTSAYVAGTKKARRQTNSFVRDIKSSLRSLAPFAGSAGLGVLAFRAIKLTDQLGKFAKQVDFSTDTVQELRFGARQLSIEVRGVDDSMRRFNRRLGLFIQDGGGPAAKAFDRLGIAVRDNAGRMRSNDEIFRDVVQRISELRTVAEQAAFASAIFGDDFGPKLVPLLAQGQRGLAAYAKEAHDLGIVLDEALIADSEEAASKIDALSQVISAQFTVAVASAAGEIATFAEGLTTVAISSTTFLTDLGRRIGILVAQSRNLIDPESIFDVRAIDQTIAKRREELAFFQDRGILLDKQAEIEREINSLLESRAALLNPAQGDLGLVRPDGDTRPGVPPPSPIAPPRVEGFGAEDLFDFDSIDRRVEISFENASLRADATRRRITESFQGTLGVMATISRGFVTGVSGAFADLFLGIEQGSFKIRNVFISAIRAMASSLIQTGFISLLSGLPGGFGDFFSKLGTSRHSGGPISAGVPYRVQKDETIIPTFAGQVVPAGGGSFQSNTTINTNGGIDRRRLLDMTLLLEERDERLKMEIAQAFRNGGF